MSVYKVFILLVSITECMERNVMTSFRILSSFECFLHYFQTEWSVFFTLQYELFTSCKVFNNTSFVSTRTGEGGWSTKCGKAWIGERGGGGVKVPKFLRTSFMNDPLLVWSAELGSTCKSKFDLQIRSTKYLISRSNEYLEIEPFSRLLPRKSGQYLILAKKGNFF